MLGKESWEVLLEAKEVFARERERCEEQLASMDWGSDVLLDAMLNTNCTSCSSSLVVPSGSEREDGIECRICEEQQDFEDAAEQALERAYSWESYVAQHDGGDPPLAECPTCGRSTYLWEENTCLRCGDSFERKCARCCGDIPPSEFAGSSLCGYCDHVMSKDD